MESADKYYERRMDSIKELSLAKKIEICKDNDLLTDEMLADLIYDSGISLKEIEETYGLDF